MTVLSGTWRYTTSSAAGQGSGRARQRQIALGIAVVYARLTPGACIVEKSEQPRNMGAYQKGGEKSIKFSNPFNGPSDGPVRDRDDYALCCTSFSKARLRTPSSFSCFHLRRVLQEILMPSHVCRVGILLLQCHPPPRYTHAVLMHPRHSFPVASIVLLCHHCFLNPCLHVSTTWASNGSGSSLSASCHFALLM